jgi:hypothetical protein
MRPPAGSGRSRSSARRWGSRLRELEVEVVDAEALRPRIETRLSDLAMLRYCQSHPGATLRQDQSTGVV